MTSHDPLLDRFSDLTYPGKRTPVNRGEKVIQVEETGWDDKPIWYVVKGEKREFFTISHLAAALGKSVVTIRSWENKGLLPRTPYSSPRPRGEMLPGTQPRGKRLWTRDQILGTIQIASEERVITNGKPPTKRFYQKVFDLYKTLSQKDSA
jgi:hypothetical protein